MVWPAIIAAGAALAGGAMSSDANRRSMHEQMDAQREFARMGIRWRVEDAKAAGIHPLYALGAQTSSFSPVAVGDTMGPAIAQAGQDISRAMDATRTANERQAALMEERALANAARIQQQQNLDRQFALEAQRTSSQLATDEAQRALLYSQARRLDQQQGPPFPSSEPHWWSRPGRGGEAPVPPVGAVKTTPSEITSAAPGVGGEVAGVEPMFLRVRLPNGDIVNFPNPKLNMDSELVMGALGARAYASSWFGSLENDGLPRGYSSSRDYRWSRRRSPFRGRSHGGQHIGPAYPHRKGL